MHIDEYQHKAHSFAGYGGNPTYPFAGLAEEAGEVLGKFAKFIRKNDGNIPLAKGVARYAQEKGMLAEGFVAANEEFVENLKKELGDVMWMVSEIATNYGLRMSDILTGNIEKLTDRANRGVIVGEGDNR